MNKTLTYNTDFAKNLQFDELALFYLLKFLNENSVIYRCNLKDLFARLKITKKIPRNYQYKTFEHLFNSLIEKEYITVTRKAHYVLKPVKQTYKYYNRKITLEKDSINWQTVSNMLLKEHIAYSKYRQELAMSYRQKLMSSNKRRNKPADIKKALKKLEALGESQCDKPIFSYRGLANETNLSLSKTHKMVEWLKEKKQIVTKTKKKILGKVACKFDFVKDLIDRDKHKAYFYQNSQNNLVAVYGSEIVSIS